ncbi:glycosyltransferase [Pseudooceanicola algae]|uniref:Glycosyl transferase family 1 domain-containing protein n=1 Tax=Pseudooceanicola algae TaxID=1537215 RepID=A0A418SEI2_9RHOB|nr:glycosyltransferase [Pseudooceanicola algae]QPM89649.1 hypothetical protein PSAL_008720 [Pseudooceanicola algae]
MNQISSLISPARIAIVDPCCAAGYASQDLEKGGLGGTEATILRVASALRAHVDVTVYQNGRTEQQVSRAGPLRSLNDRRLEARQDAIVVINRWKVALKLRKQHRDTPIFLWLHVYPGRHNRKMGAALKAADVTVICVSRTHAEDLRHFLGPDNTPNIQVIYNPIDDNLRPDETTRNPDRLLFASSPHKGLAEVFCQFRTLRQHFPDLTLCVADPGYLNWETGPVPEGVVFLGSLSHAALIRQMRRALCLFYPQTSFAETFGLVLAEANAVGTPVLVQEDLGANAEIVADPRQRVDGQDPDQILARIRAWRRAPMQVCANPEFRLSAVADAWIQVFKHATAPQKQMSEVSQ